LTHVSESAYRRDVPPTEKTQTARAAEAVAAAATVPRRPRTLLAMSRELPARLFGGAGAYEALAGVADVVEGVVADDFGREEVRAALAEAEVLLSCWGCPEVDEGVLAAAPRLRAIVHAAGTVRGIVTPAVHRRGIAVSSAAWANAVPVAEYTVAAVLMANKRVLGFRESYRRERAPSSWWNTDPRVGNYRRVVGLVGASQVGRRVIELLAPYDLEVLVYDPYLGAEEAARLGVRTLELDELCAASDVLSIHAPELPSTRHLIDARRLALLPDGATVINTARGSLLDTDALVAEVRTGRIDAVIDVTEPEVLPPGHPLYDLPNVLLTPHIAGSSGGELGRLAAAVTDELARYAAGLAFAHPVRAEESDRTA
jgi:phosphoglycerate dehydrogenase-like enzyme